MHCYRWSVYAAQPNRRCQPGGMPRHSRLAYICGALITLQPSPTSTLIAQGGSSASKPAATGPTQELGGAGLCFTASASRQCSARPCTMAQLSSTLGSASLRPAAPARARPARQRAALCFSNADGKCQCGSGGRRSSGAALPVVQGRRSASARAAGPHSSPCRRPSVLQAACRSTSTCPTAASMGRSCA